jgi:hypothetical protein
MFLSDGLVLKRGSTFFNVEEAIVQKETNYNILGIFQDQHLSNPCLLANVINPSTDRFVFVKCMKFYFFSCECKKYFI